MGQDDVDIRVRLREARKAAADAKRVDKGLLGIGSSAKKSERDAKGLGRALSGIGRGAFTGAVGGATALAGSLYGVGRAGVFAVNSAVDQGEQVSKNKVVFQSGAQDVLNFAATTSTGFGLSQRAALEASGTFGNMLVPMGIARDRAAAMSSKMVALGGDMASFNNASPEETLDALRAGLAGETEPLRRFGVFLNAARVEQKAMSMGLKDGKKDLTAAAKAQATYAVILEDTKDTQGDYARTSDSLANRQRTLKAQWEDLGASIGKGAIPELEKAAGAASEFLSLTQKIANRQDIDLGEKAGLVRGAFTKEMGPLAAEIGEALNDAQLGNKLSAAVEKAAPQVMNAMAAQAPRAASAFANAFVNAGPGGQLLTVALLAAKLGAFPAVGKLMAGRMAGTFATQLPTSLDARKGAMNGAVRTRGQALGGVMGKALGVAAVAGIGYELWRFAKENPALGQYSGSAGWKELFEDIKDYAPGEDHESRDRVPRGVEARPGRKPIGNGPAFPPLTRRPQTARPRGKKLELRADVPAVFQMDSKTFAESMAGVSLKQAERGGR